MDWEPRVGMRVVCIKDRPRLYEEDGYIYPTEGKIYHIRGVISENNKTGLLLAEIKNRQLNGADEAYFNYKHFRPIDERRLDIFRSMLTPTRTDAENAAGMVS